MMNKHDQGLGHLAIATANMAESLAFYARIGGLENWFFTGPSGERIELLKML